MSRPGYRERLLPKWWAWIVGLGLISMLAIAYGGALGARAGLLVAVGGAALAVWLLWITSPVVRVDDRGLHAAAASLPMGSISAARPVDRAEIAALRGPGSDARMFVVLRPWSARGAVLVTLDDPLDPHPGWLVSARRPERLTGAIAAGIRDEP